MVPTNIVDLAALGIAVISVVVAAWVIYQVAQRFIDARLVIETVTGPKDFAHLEAMTSVIRSELFRLQQEGAGSGLSFVSGNDKPIALPETLEAPSTVKLLAQVADYIPGRRRVLSVRVHASGARGLGVTAAFEGGTGRVKDVATIWEADFFPDYGDSAADMAERAHRLALIVAAWATFELAERARADHRIALLTQDWESQAYFLLASRLRQSGRTGDARQLYAKALDRDPYNRGALFMLGTLDLLELDNASARERFRAVVGLLERDAFQNVAPFQLDRLWYRATYNLAAASWHAYLLRHEADMRNEARQRAEKVVRTADEAMVLLGDSSAMMLGGPYADLVRFLALVRDSALIVYAEAAGSPMAAR